MINFNDLVVKNQISGSFYPSKNFSELIEFFNELEEKLNYPNCENALDRQNVLLKAETDLILWVRFNAVQSPSCYS